MVTLFQTGYNLNEIDLIVKKVWKIVSPYPVITFSGEMGAGKTTFIYRLCHYLGVQDAVSSPTFSIINEYHFTGKGGEEKIIFHIDLYRLRDMDEAINAGIEDCILQSSKDIYSFIEWPEKAMPLIPIPHININLQTVNELMRNIMVSVVE